MRMPSHSTQVLIVGSGAGGAMTALELARAGLSVVVLEEGNAHSTVRGYHDARRAVW